MSTLLFLSLSHLGVGILWTLAIVGRGAGIKFFRFNAGLAAILLAIALAFRPDGTAIDAGAQGAGLAALVLATAALVVYWATIGRALSAARPWILGTAIAAGTVALVLQALGLAAGAPASLAVLTVASVLTSAALLGTTCTAMILGHWYLVLPSMDVKLLKDLVLVLIGSALVRTMVAGAAILLALTAWQGALPLDFGRYVTSVSGIFFWQRVLFGLAGPLVLSYLTWETAKISSTQSATGILYVDFFAVLAGELLAKYLLLATRVPV